MNAYIVAGYRTAVGKAPRGGFRFTRPDDLGAAVIKHLLEQTPQLDPTRVDDVIVGNAVPEAEQGMQMGRYVALLSLPKNVSGITINRYCGSGVEAIAMASAKIHAGMAECIIAGGTESMSLVPTMGWKTALNYEIAHTNPDYYLSMGLTAEQVAKDFNISREAQDEFSFQSHQKALRAQKEGWFADGIVPVTVKETYFDQASGKKKTKETVISQDEGPRADTTVDALNKLKPVFAAGGSVTAGNSSQTSDGAAFVLVMSERLVNELGLKPIARMMSYATAGVDPRIMGIGPVAAVPLALKQAGLKLGDIQQVELNEAFAAQSLAVIQELGIDPTIVNPNGGAIALGHALGSTGARLSVQLFNEMKRRDQKYGMVTACVGGGQGVAGIYERLN
ncbi:acetyl-CoA acyltransferase [Dyadobacter sp. BE34]|uniref:acetyl-CoA C-acyltransferase n=1 Tax=Dyadobacter fermentans TaxID=94254 RepID=A0ABU1R2U3_9BACT|nr:MULTISPECIES: acetyl-CoA C-acyltransferase [Dyadobacter]MDR6807734.1 acetyl-CoA acyltransferase [Dyadobacter fermentans]MDR7045475.1 acetyl-CoA acyltransferase [Dyadobacter sp. BE242]MDR7199788.1 acetyl-CoA acyltransferase [Dyadobacter sp. BE34]MDR7217753.1 acetyl-CoA acyltransferase [Dyadobacter sp. BE31]MDR7265679.1 acetyl-CoA acyltransferase [Dyadobacter sp. BE32]